MFRLTLATAVAAAALVVSPAPAGAAVQDPERNLSTPTAWQWWTDLTKQQLDAKELRAGSGMRVIDIEVADPDAPRFHAAMVHNSGPYERERRWFSDKSRDQVKALTEDQGWRLIDIETYIHDGKRRFAGVAVADKGEANKSWRWNYDRTADQVSGAINKHKLRLIDLDVHDTSNGPRYDFVGIANKGVDKRGWWWYLDVDRDFIVQKEKEHGARVLDIDRAGHGHNVVLMVRNKESLFTRFAYGMTADELSRFVASNGLRITDIERRGDLYYAATMDDVDRETARIRGILHSSPYASGYFGAFSKRVGGRTYVGLAHTSPYQPMSVQKLVPHLYVMDLLDQGKADLDGDTIYWTAPIKDSNGDACPGVYEGKTFNFFSSLRKVLERALRKSINNRHEALVNTYGPEQITERVHELGLGNTDLYFGCKHPGKKTWLSNRTTLAEMGELFEGVELKLFFPNRWEQTRDEFYGIMKSWKKKWFQTVVEEEAAKQGKSWAVESFMSEISFKGKGGGAESSRPDGTWRAGRALSYRATFPVRAGTGTATIPRAFVGGFFVNNMHAPCVEDDAKNMPDQVSEECRDYAEKAGNTFRTLAAEVMRIPIREVLETWPSAFDGTDPVATPIPAPSPPRRPPRR